MNKPKSDGDFWQTSLSINTFAPCYLQQRLGKGYGGKRVTNKPNYNKRNLQSVKAVYAVRWMVIMKDIECLAL